MTWSCANHHEVREGMFFCSVCGSDDVRDRALDDVVQGEVVAPTQTPDEVAAQARNALTLCVVAGPVLLVVSYLVARASADSFDDGGLVVAYAVLVAGWVVLMLGVIGHAVRLGVLAAGLARG